MDFSEIPDVDLVRMYADGNPEAMGALCDRHHGRLMFAAARIAGQDADDALQDGCLKAVRKADTYRGDSAVTTWLHRIVINAALDLVRRRPLVAEPASEPSTGPETAPADARIDLSAQWQKLSRDHQAALLLTDMLGYPVAEAARILNIPEGTIKARAARGRARLRGLMAPLPSPGLTSPGAPLRHCEHCWPRDPERAAARAVSDLTTDSCDSWLQRAASFRSN